MDDLTTRTKVRSVFKCKKGHLIPGSEILKHGKMECPIDYTEIDEDVTFTEEGRFYHALTRGDLSPTEGSV